MVSWKEILPLIQPSLTEEEKSLPMWQKVVQENYKAQKSELEKYFEQVFSAINCSQIQRWKRWTGDYHRHSQWTRKAVKMAKKQAHITLNNIAAAISVGGGETEIAEIMRYERAYEHNPYFEEDPRGGSEV